jgi:hypothetical protein
MLIIVVVGSAGATEGLFVTSTFGLPLSSNFPTRYKFCAFYYVFKGELFAAALLWRTS